MRVELKLSKCILNEMLLKAYATGLFAAQTKGLRYARPYVAERNLPIELEYTRVGDYLLPNITAGENPSYAQE